jgi:multicomponent Na+:H+ antiporter subunit G
MIDVVSAVLMVTGALLAVVAGAGLHRFRDVFARMHAATKPATLGLALVLVGAALQMPDTGSVVKLLLVVLLQFYTAPVGSHLVGRAAYRDGIPMEPVPQVDELAEETTPAS